MKIARIETIPLAIPHDHGGPPPAWGGQAWQGLTILLVRVETEDGASGWGEGFSYNCMPALQAVIDATVAPILIGRDATDIVSLNRELQQALHLFRPLRHHHVRHLRHRHRALGPRGQEGGAAACTGSRRAGHATAGSGLCEPAQVPGPGACRCDRARRPRRGLPRHQAARNGRARDRGGARSDGHRHAALYGHELPVDAGRSARDGGTAQALRPLLAGGTHLSAGGLRGAGAVAAGVGHRSRLWGECLHRVRVPAHAGCRRGALRATERDQGGRRDRVPQGARAGRRL